MATSDKSSFKVKRVCQIGVVVKDLDKVVEDWSNLFGFGPWSFVDTPTMRLASAFVGPVQFELAQPVEGQPQGRPGKLFSDFLSKWGDGVHHVAFCVDDVNEEVSKLTARGVEVIARHDGDWAYVESSGPGSTIFELQPRSTHDQLKKLGISGFVEAMMKRNQAEDPQ